MSGRGETLSDHHTHHVRSNPCADSQVHFLSYTIPHLLYTITRIYIVRLAVFRYTVPVVNPMNVVVSTRV